MDGGSPVFLRLGILKKGGWWLAFFLRLGTLKKAGGGLMTPRENPFCHKWLEKRTHPNAANRAVGNDYFCDTKRASQRLIPLYKENLPSITLVGSTPQPPELSSFPKPKEPILWMDEIHFAPL